MDTSRNLVSLVQTSFKQIAPYSDAFAVRFYAFLFDLDPSLRGLFKGDMVQQGRKLTQILAIVVNGLDRLEDLTGAVESLGRRHVGYGVTDAHYTTVATA